MAVVLEGAEIVLAIGIVGGIEIVEGANALQDRSLVLLGQGTDAASEQDLAVGQVLPGLVRADKARPVAGEWEPPSAHRALRSRPHGDGSQALAA